MRVIDAVKETIADVSIHSPSSERRRANARNVSYVLVSFTASITSSEHSVVTPTNKQTNKQTSECNEPDKRKELTELATTVISWGSAGSGNQNQKTNKQTNKQTNREGGDWEPAATSCRKLTLFPVVPRSSGSTYRVT